MIPPRSSLPLFHYLIRLRRHNHWWRPIFSSIEGTGKPTDPVHAVLIVDNSLSMGYEKLDGTLLDEAKTKAREFIDALPQGSRISVLPLCGSAAGIRASS